MRARDDSAPLTTATWDITAFETFYRRYVGRVTAYAVARCSSSADVGDVVAQTFVRLLHVGDHYDPSRGDPAAFVFAVAGSVLRDHYRRNRREHALVHRLAGRDLLATDEIERLESAIDASRRAPAARDALEAVTESEGEILRMVAHGATPAEAAVALGISPGAARGRLFRARRRVQAKLATEEATKR
jgi:RNA polymerase sigma-70 factor, ECF subfamily